MSCYRVEESLDDITTKTAKPKPTNKKTLSAYKPGEYKNKPTASEPQENTLVDEMDTIDITRYIEQEHNTDSDVDLFS